MRHLLRVWIVLGLGTIALLTACEEVPAQTADLPTVMVLPSLTATETPSDTPQPTPTSTPTETETTVETPTPSETAAPTLSSTPSETATSTPTETLAPSETPVASDTPTETSTPTVTNTTTNTPTRTRTSTPTRTNTPRASATSSRTPTSIVQVTNAFPSITAFAASSTDVAGGAQITLTWQAEGDEARIDQQDSNGLVQTTTSVPVSGSLNVAVPNAQAGRVFYRLVVKRGVQEITQTVEIRVQTQCAVNWFFGNEFVANENVGCPPAAAVQVVGAHQSFEVGEMFNLNIDGENMIYALVRMPGKNGQYASDQYGSAINRWDGVTNSCTNVPPPGTMQPAQQFGWMACSQFALGGFWIEGTGYAVSGIDLNPRNVQRATDGTLFVDAPDGNVYRLNPLLPGALTATWKRIK